MEYAVSLRFKVTNNEVEYEAILGGLKMARAVMAKEIEVQTDSQLVAKKYSGEFEIISPSMKRYAEWLKKVSEEFDQFKLVKIDRTINSKVDAFAKLGTDSRSIDLRSIVLIGWDKIILEEGFTIEVGCVEEKESWMTEIV